MRCVRLSSVGVQRDRNFRHARAEKTRLDDHLGGELHPRAPLRQPLVVRTGKATHPAVHVADRRSEPSAGQPGEHWVSPPSMEEGHGAGEQRAATRWKATALREIVALAKLVEKARYLAEVVAIVRVAHKDVSAAGGRDAPHERRPVALLAHHDDARSQFTRDRHRGVGRAVVRDDHLAQIRWLRSVSMALRTQTPIVSASLKHGITIEISTSRVAMNG